MTTGSDGIRDESEIYVRLGGETLYDGQSFLFEDTGQPFHTGGTGDRRDTTFVWFARATPCVPDSALVRGFEIQHRSTSGGSVAADNWTMQGLTISDVADNAGPDDPGRVLYDRPPATGPIYRFKANTGAVWNTTGRDDGVACRVRVMLTTGADGIRDDTGVEITLGGQKLIFDNADGDDDLDPYTYVDSNGDEHDDLPNGVRTHRGGTGDRPYDTLTWNARLSPCAPYPLLRIGVRVEHVPDGFPSPNDDWELAGLRIVDLDTNETYIDRPISFDPPLMTFHNDTDTVFTTGATWPLTAPADAAVDTDQDGLTDRVELHGIPKGDGTFDTWLPDHGADPCRRTVAVDLDWLAEKSQPGEPPAPSDRPLLTALNETKDTFTRAPIQAPASCPYGWRPSSGVQLMIDIMNGAIKVSSAEREQPLAGDLGRRDLQACASGASSPQFCVQREAHFPAWREGFFHYSLWGKRFHAGSTTSGHCCYGPHGTDFMVTLGAWPPRSPAVSSRIQAGTFVHELGHALDLQHGGEDSANFKPNYASVMNYRYQTVGVTDFSAATAALGRLPTETDFDDRESLLVASGRVDYSRRELRPLNPKVLLESAGVEAAEDYAVTWWDPDFVLRAGNGLRGIDWDNSQNGTANPDNGTANVNIMSGFEVCAEPPEGSSTLATTVHKDDRLVRNKIIAFDGKCDSLRKAPDVGVDQGFDFPTTFGYRNGVLGHDDWQTLRYRLDGQPGTGEPGMTEPEHNQQVTDLFDAIAGHPAPPSIGPRWAYAYVTAATTAEAPIGVTTALHPGWNWSTGGGQATVVHTDTGEYQVRLPGIAAASGVAHVTAYRTVYRGRTCAVTSYRPDGLDELLGVRCVDEAGNPIDWWFTAMFTSPTIGTHPYATVRYDGAGNADPAVNNGTFNSAGQPNQVLHDGVGQYRVRLNGAAFAAGTGHVQITPYGGSVAARCAAEHLTTLPTAVEIAVTCRTIDGHAHQDSGWLLSYTDGVGLHGDETVPAAYTQILGDPAAPTIDATHSWSTTGATPTVTRLGTGWYRLTWANGGKLGGNVHITATGSSGGYCHLGVINDYAAQPQLSIDVYCHTPSGQRGDNTFGVAYIRRP
ncbi:hypothetical protein GCM10023170_067430 [Phytohabitans houttuyneae]